MSIRLQWLLTGRHLTLRADGNSVDNYAFGGPIIYGHSREKARENVFYYQTKKINELYGALNKDQASRALLTAVPPREDDIKPQGKNGQFPGLQVSEMSSDQKALVKDTLELVFAPYRKEDSHEALSMIDKAGGIDQLRFAFYSQEDLDDDKMWDIWRIEGPNAVCYFRGSPHVHAYVNTGDVS